jgi:hypothetical protein
MPTIVTRGLGYDEGRRIYVIGDSFAAELIVEDPLVAELEWDEVVLSELDWEDTVGGPISAQLVISEDLSAEVNIEEVLIGYILEEGATMSTTGEIRINMYTREDRTLTLNLKYPDGAPVDLTGGKGIFTVKEKSADLDAAAIFQKKTSSAGGSDDEFDFVNAEGGKAEIYIVPDDTLTVAPGIYLWDIRITLANLKTYTILRGRISFKESITKTLP